LKILFGIALVFGLISHPFVDAEISSPRVAIYLVDIIENETALNLDGWTNNPKYFNSIVTQEYILATAVYCEPPILVDDDIVELCSENQHMLMLLTASAAEKWDMLGISNRYPLVIVIDEVPCYAAIRWPPLSSVRCRLPMFWSRTINNRLSVSAGGDSVDYSKMKQVMLELGKLRECRGIDLDDLIE
jgi:hypothetical protein